MSVSVNDLVMIAAGAALESTGRHPREGGNLAPALALLADFS